MIIYQFGGEGLNRIHLNKSYSKELKIAAVEDYLTGELFNVRHPCEIRD